MNQEKIGAFIKKIRNEKELTQQELADKIGVTDRAISKWENGRGTPDISLLIPLAKELDITVLELLNGEKTEDQNNAIIKLIKGTDRKIKIWRILSLILLNSILIVMILITIFGYIIPHQYENNNTKGIARVQSESMKPILKPGDSIIYDKIDINRIKKNDIVVYYYMDNNETILHGVKVMHRVIGITTDINGKPSLITKGDNNNVVDEINVTEKNYLGLYNNKISPITNMFLRNETTYITPIHLSFIILMILFVLYIDILQLKNKFFNK